MSGFIDIDNLSAKYRSLLVDVDHRKVLVTNFHGTEQEKDFKEEPANCDGFGRVRYFKRSTTKNWPSNPLPIDPALQALQLPASDMIRAQIFQNAACNMRCWYCFVPFSLLEARKEYSAWLSPSELLSLYLNQPQPPQLIDLSGGEPSLVPEWVPWMMEEIQSRGLEDRIFLWSDDNLSNDFFWRYLDGRQIDLVRNFPKYAKVCCFKGFDAESFAFNTRVNPKSFGKQFELMKRVIDLGIDVYAYVTLTCPSDEGIHEKLVAFMDRLQKLDKYLLLRTIPLEIRPYSAMTARLNESSNNSLVNQTIAISSWTRELQRRYEPEDLALPITQIRLGA